MKFYGVQLGLIIALLTICESLQDCTTYNITCEDIVRECPPDSKSVKICSKYNDECDFNIIKCSEENPITRLTKKNGCDGFGINLSVTCREAETIQ